MTKMWLVFFWVWYTPPASTGYGTTVLQKAWQVDVCLHSIPNECDTPEKMKLKCQSEMWAQERRTKVESPHRGYRLACEYRL